MKIKSLKKNTKNEVMPVKFLLNQWKHQIGMILRESLYYTQNQSLRLNHYFFQCIYVLVLFYPSMSMSLIIDLSHLQHYYFPHPIRYQSLKLLIS